MREKSSECTTTHVNYVRSTSEMCSRDPPALHPSLAKANGKNSSPQASPKAETKIDSGLLPTPGGRLKFFKDGKFILELSHRKDGERTTWFPVPKKTFWPPASTTPNRQESSTSLSVSDDNSSIQSSPWQRDHCWKQTHPRRCLTTEYNFYYRRDPRNRLSVSPRKLLRKRRRPLDTTIILQQQQQQQQINSDTNKYNNRTINNKLNNNHNNYQQSTVIGRTLTLIIDKLSRLDPNVVSPRKRILRELEKVTLEDQASKRRATPQPQPQQQQQQQQHHHHHHHQHQHQQVTLLSSSSSSSSSSTITTTTTSSSMTFNKNSTIQSPKQLSSYSITSILGEDKPNQEQGFLRNLLKLDDGVNSGVKYTTNHGYTRTRNIDPFLTTPATSIHHQLYGVPMLPPSGPFRSTGHWMHYPSPVHYPPPLPIYPPQPPPHPSSSPVHHYKDYREQTLTPPSDMPLNLSKHAG